MKNKSGVIISEFIVSISVLMMTIFSFHYFNQRLMDKRIVHIQARNSINNFTKNYNHNDYKEISKNYYLNKLENTLTEDQIKNLESGQGNLKHISGAALYSNNDRIISRIHNVRYDTAKSLKSGELHVYGLLDGSMNLLTHASEKFGNVESIMSDLPFGLKLLPKFALVKSVSGIDFTSSENNILNSMSLLDNYRKEKDDFSFTKLKRRNFTQYYVYPEAGINPTESYIWPLIGLSLAKLPRRSNWYATDDKLSQSYKGIAEKNKKASFLSKCITHFNNDKFCLKKKYTSKYYRPKLAKFPRKIRYIRSFLKKLDAALFAVSLVTSGGTMKKAFDEMRKKFVKVLVNEIKNLVKEFAYGTLAKISEEVTDDLVESISDKFNDVNFSLEDFEEGMLPREYREIVSEQALRDSFNFNREIITKREKM